MQNYPTILIAGDQAVRLDQLQAMLDSSTANIIVADTRQDVLANLKEQDIALVILSIASFDSTGFNLARIIRNTEYNRDVPIIFITEAGGSDWLSSMHTTGAIDYLEEPVNPVVLRSKVLLFTDLYQQNQRLKQQNLQLMEHVKEMDRLKDTCEKLESLSMIDSLTGIPNRRNFEQYLEIHWRSCMRNRLEISLLLIDIDCFGKYNETYSEARGDMLLKILADAIFATVKRPWDLVARYEGDKFFVALPYTDVEGANYVSWLIRQKIDRLMIPHEGSTVSKIVTTSFGVTTTIPDTSKEMGDFIRSAYDALGMAKRNGRDRIENVIFE